jgi:hypothetical protein
MIMVAILCTVVLTTITVAMGTQTRTGLDNAPTTLVVSSRARRRSRRGAGSTRVHPQYLPAVARARILRAQLPRVGLGDVRRRETR